MLRLLLENGASVKLADQSVIEKLCSIKNHEIAEHVLELLNNEEENHHVHDKVTIGAKLRFNKTMMCLIGVYQKHEKCIPNSNVEFEKLLEQTDLFERTVAIMNSRRKKTFEYTYSCHEKKSYYLWLYDNQNDCYKKLSEVIRYIIENDLQSTLNDTGYDKNNEFKDKKCIEVLNDRHYEIVKSELTFKYILEHNAVIEGVCHHQLEYACIIEDAGLVKMILEYYDGLGALERKKSTNTKEGAGLQNNSFLVNKNTDLSEEYVDTKILLDRGQPIKSYDFVDGVKVAASLANIQILELLLYYKLDSKNDFEIMEAAVQSENINVIKLLLENGLSVKDSAEIINVALKTNNVEMTRLLLENGAEICGYSRYLKNVDLDDIETLRLILNNCPDVRDDSYLLDAAIKKDNLESYSKKKSYLWGFPSYQKQ
ncbi:hypothetical protein AX774_g5884 [Zancudomyces culisetae]|uniref:Ankyrin repeat protein n=1 Tax=Zancudomyces culisetae TaxID=1213189 RepID=A0A1R1PI65_ZANCU|nr:hypothetical protein AX774_g5884 [Zancudomyces culisetae]|eukprot:OMH80674.1 hypothetical protein AX774_g5884 [Zancudomyces culisetae]